MKLNFLYLFNDQSLIDGVVLHPLKENADQRGSLAEIIRCEEAGKLVKNNHIAQAYYSITKPRFARDEKRWHVHPTKQIDRFKVLKGNAVFALYDWRKKSKTYGLLNLFLLGEHNGQNDFLLVIPKNVLHTFCVVGGESCYLIGLPSTIYDPKEEGRVSFKDVTVTFPDGKSFAWQPVRDFLTKQRL